MRFDANATAARRGYLAVRNGLLYRILTPRVLLVGVAVLVVGCIVYIKTRPTPAELATRAAEAAAARDRAALAAVKTDLRKAETAEEVYFSNYTKYGTLKQLQAEGNFSLSTGMTMTITAATNGYTINAENGSIATGITNCTVQVGAGAASAVDGMVFCGNREAPRQ